MSNRSALFLARVKGTSFGARSLHELPYSALRNTTYSRSPPNASWSSFLGDDLGYFDKERDRVEPGPSPFMPDKVLTMCPEQGVNHVIG